MILIIKEKKWSKVEFCHKNNIISDKKCVVVELSRNLHFLTRQLQLLLIATKKVLKVAK